MLQGNTDRQHRKEWIILVALALLGVVGCSNHITNKQFPDTCMHYEQQRLVDGTLRESKIIY